MNTDSKLCLLCNGTYPEAAINCPIDGSQLIFVSSEKPQTRPEQIPGYTLEKEIGLGNSGKVYKATHDRTGRVVAIKILHESLINNLEMVNRFKKEADLSSHLSSKHTVAVKDFGLLNDGRPFMAMDYIEGTCVGAIVDHEGPIALERALPIFIQVAAGLAHAHDLGIMHRDIKPYNIMLIEQDNEHDVVKIIDFGIAKRWKSSEHSLNLTITGEAVGTPVYMSPEQCIGAPVDHRTDIYSLGCVMYEVLTGRLVFSADNPISLMTKHVHEQPAGLGFASSEVADELERIVLKTLAKRPAERYRTAHELKDDLLKLYHG